jgi:hypothetical protein
MLHFLKQHTSPVHTPGSAITSSPICTALLDEIFTVLLDEIFTVLLDEICSTRSTIK